MTPPPPRLWACFVPEPASEPLPAPAGSRLTRYVVERVHRVRGAPLTGVTEGCRLCRIESAATLAAPGAALAGVTQHVVYTDASDRSELTRVSAAETGPTAVLIPISKTAAWWALAQDERQAHFRRGRAPGHVAVGLPFADRIFRRLYHARYVPGSEWDFLTYFEFTGEHTDAFMALLAGLRDTEQNPEWAFVDRETEVWMRKE